MAWAVGWGPDRFGTIAEECLLELRESDVEKTLRVRQGWPTPGRRLGPNTNKPTAASLLHLRKNRPRKNHGQGPMEQGAGFAQPRAVQFSPFHRSNNVVVTAARESPAEEPGNKNPMPKKIAITGVVSISNRHDTLPYSNLGGQAGSQGALANGANLL